MFWIWLDYWNEGSTRDLRLSAVIETTQIRYESRNHNQLSRKHEIIILISNDKYNGTRIL